MNIGTPRFYVMTSILTHFVKSLFEQNVTHSIQGTNMTNSVKCSVRNYFHSSMSHHQVTTAVSLVTNYILTNVLIFVLCNKELLVVCKRILQ